MICIIFRVDPSFVPETGTLRQSPIEMATGKGFQHTVSPSLFVSSDRSSLRDDALNRYTDI